MHIKCHISLVYVVFSKYIPINICLRQYTITWEKTLKNTNQKIIENNEWGVMS